mmetsp:Transcript_19565/g.68015  ORF Transcript_19565/g.68015 Transcript_19565/m.68015 type:complete len:653 (-) Transcript_19565:566-2524(-)
MLCAVLISAAVLLTLLRLVLSLLLPACRRLGAGQPLGVKTWEQHFGAGKRVLIVCGKGGSETDLAVMAGRSGSSISIFVGARVETSSLVSEGLPEVVRRDLTKHHATYDVVLVDRYLSGLPEDEAESSLNHLFSLVSGGGVLLVQDLTVLPASLFFGLAEPLRRGLDLLWAWMFVTTAPLCGPPYDTAAWLPSDANLEVRRAAGRLHEALVVRKLKAPPNEAIEHLRRLHGGTSMAFCTSPEAHRIGTPEHGIRYFLASAHSASSVDGSTAKSGYVAYVEQVIMGVRLRLVLMDPVCAPGDRETTLRTFLADCDAVQSRPIFSCISDDWKSTLHQCGLHTTMLGGEVGIRLASYTLSKDRRRYLRAGPAKGLECHTECHDLQELQEINATWVGNKASGTEMLIWTWPPSLPEAEAGGDGAPSKADGVRRLFTYQDGRLVGFVCAEPYYRGDGSGEVLGYGLNTIRFLPNLSPPWISDFTIARLIQSLQTEGTAEYLAFGISPFCDAAAHDGDIRWLRSLVQFAGAIDLEAVYPIQGLARKKAHQCAGQGVRLHDRFVSSDPEFVLGDTVRFLTVLFGDNLPMIPATLCCMLSGAARDAIAHGTRLACTALAAAKSTCSTGPGKASRRVERPNKVGSGLKHAAKQSRAGVGGA